MTVIEAQEAFTEDELNYLHDTAEERGMTLWELIHDSVMNAPY
jgi:hypothetical protein